MFNRLIFEVRRTCSMPRRSENYPDCHLIPKRGAILVIASQAAANCPRPNNRSMSSGAALFDAITTPRAVEMGADAQEPTGARPLTGWADRPCHGRVGSRPAAVMFCMRPPRGGPHKHIMTTRREPQRNPFSFPNHGTNGAHCWRSVEAAEQSERATSMGRCSSAGEGQSAAPAGAPSKDRRLGGR
jgi:hypothetical protein